MTVTIFPFMKSYNISAIRVTVEFTPLILSCILFSEISVKNRNKMKSSDKK